MKFKQLLFNPIFIIGFGIWCIILATMDGAIRDITYHNWFSQLSLGGKVNAIGAMLSIIWLFVSQFIKYR